MFIISVVTEEMITVAVAWGFLTHKNRHIYEHGVFEPLRKKLEQLQGLYVKRSANSDDSDDDDYNEQEVGATPPGMVLTGLSMQKIVVCDFEKAILLAIK